MTIRVSNKTPPFLKAFAKGILLWQEKECVPGLLFGRPFGPNFMFMMSLQ